MPTEPTPADGRRARAQQTRRKLLAAAIRVVGRDGPGAVTHRAVAAEAGLAKSLATYHFASIDDLLVAALVESTEEYARQVAADLPPDCPLDELAAHLAAFFDARRHEWLAYYELVLYAARHPALRTAALAWSQWLREVARRHTDDPAAVDAFVSAVDGFGLYALLSDDPLDAPRLAALLARIVTHP
ncbi:TetR family transcriptional regulator [Actinomycetes bacterium KLBMP 9797]